MVKFLKPVTRLKVVGGEEAAAMREQRYQRARARLAPKIQEANLSEEEIMAEIQAFREGK